MEKIAFPVLTDEEKALFKVLRTTPNIFLRHRRYSPAKFWIIMDKHFNPMQYAHRDTVKALVDKKYIETPIMNSESPGDFGITILFDPRKHVATKAQL